MYYGNNNKRLKISKLWNDERIKISVCVLFNIVNCAQQFVEYFIVIVNYEKFFDNLKKFCKETYQMS